MKRLKLPRVKYVWFPTPRKAGRKGGRVFGRWYPPKSKDLPGSIEIEMRQGPAEMFDTLLHELLHEICRDHTEEWTSDSATLLADVLWREGYRKVSQ